MNKSPDLSAPCYWVLRNERTVLLTAADGGPDLPLGPAEDFAGIQDPLLIGEWRGLPCWAAEVAELPASPGGEWLSLRAAFAHLGMEGFALAGRGFQLLDWQRHHRYCGACATPTERLSGEFGMRCPVCELVAYPRISPAVMVVVKRDGRLLLARSARFSAGIYGALAGFVEPGETVEQCAAREVREEVGIEIANLRYFGSQPWPFPNSLMLAFVADYAGGDLRPDGQEIEAADWFAPDALPALPMPMSIAHQLIVAACGDEVS
jgi:NAD+ diphosphatase